MYLPTYGSSSELVPFICIFGSPSLSPVYLARLLLLLRQLGSSAVPDYLL